MALYKNSKCRKQRANSTTMGHCLSVNFFLMLQVRREHTYQWQGDILQIPERRELR